MEQTDVSDLQSLTESIGDQLDTRGATLQLKIGEADLLVEDLDELVWAGSSLQTARPIYRRDIFHYYTAVAPLLLPHLQDRPVSLRYYPRIWGEAGIIERRWPAPVPDFVKTVEIFSEQTNDNEPAIIINNVSALLWLVNQRRYEFYPWLSRITPKPGLPNIFINSTGTLELSVLNYPDYLVFKLEAPSPGSNHPPLFNTTFSPDQTSSQAAWGMLIKASKAMRECLATLSLTPLPQLDGQNGLLVYLPIDRQYTFAQVRRAAQAIREYLAAEHPDLFSLAWQVSGRHGKVFLQADQNTWARLRPSPYSLSWAGEPLVALPLSWEQLEELSSASYHLDQVLANLEHGGWLHTLPASDPWRVEPVGSALPADFLA